MKKEDNDQSIIDEIIESLNIDEDIKKDYKKVNEKYITNKKKSTYKQSVEDYVKEEYEIIMDCSKSDYFVFYKKK